MWKHPSKQNNFNQPREERQLDLCDLYLASLVYLVNFKLLRDLVSREKKMNFIKVWPLASTKNVQLTCTHVYSHTYEIHTYVHTKACQKCKNYFKSFFIHNLIPDAKHDGIKLSLISSHINTVRI